MIQPSVLRRQAEEQLQKTPCDFKRLVLLHTAIALGSSVLMTALNYLFNLQIADTGGLGGLGLRSVLATTQSVLELAVMVALPFWQVGILYSALQWAKGEKTGFQDLLQGFRRFGSVLGQGLLRGGLFFALGIAILYISTAVFMLTSFATPLLELFAPVFEQSTTPEQLETLLTPELLTSASQTLTPLLVIFLILYGLVAIPLFYRLRFSDFAVMEGMSAGKALLKSLAITRKNCLQVLKLDLSFWWFYLLQLLSVAICYADTLLTMLGVTLPLSKEVSYFLFYLLGTLCQVLLLWQWEGHRLTTYCLAYRALDYTPVTPITDDPSSVQP